MTVFAPDPAVPRRDVLLNGPIIGRRIAGRLASNGPLVPRCCERVRSKYRVGESLRTVYRLDAGSGSYTLAARTFPRGAGERAYARALESAVPCGPLRPVFHDPELGAVFWTYPNDRKIANLPALTGPAPLGDLLGGRCARTALVTYAPEASATARCLDASGRLLAYAKVQAGDSGRRTCDIHEALVGPAHANGHTLRLPRALAYSPPLRTLVLEAVPGRPLADLTGPDLEVAIERMGAALAELHELPVPPTAPAFERLAPERLTSAAQVIARARPDAAEPAMKLAALLVGQSRYAGAEEPVCLHGDPHLANALAHDDRIALVDLEHVSSGPAAADLARVLAGLFFQRVLGQLKPAAERALAERVLRGYAAVRPLPAAESLGWHSAASVLARCALPAVGRVRPRAVGHLRALLIEAAEVAR